jgi:hypothetical protein
MAMSPEEDRDFTEFLRTKAGEAERLIKHRPTLFLQMLASGGGYTTAVQLLSSRSISEGFTKLWTGKHLELTVEALVLETHWRPHFDPILQDVALKRLRAADYEPKIFSAAPTPAISAPPLPPTNAGAPPPAVSVGIEWDAATEIVPLQLNLLKAGSGLQTVETWDDGSAPKTYEARCESIHLRSDGWHLVLTYDRQHGSNKEIARAYRDVLWGTLRLHIAADLAEASAVFEPDNGDPPGHGTCSVLRTELYAKLSRAQVSVLLRPGQAALREELLARFGRCAISDESAKEALEVAHIIDHSASGSATIQNALLLRADLHALYDSGNLLIGSDGSISLVGLPETSRYHDDLAQLWNKSLPKDVLVLVSRALSERKRQAP